MLEACGRLQRDTITALIIMSRIILTMSVFMILVSDNPLRPPEGTSYQNELAGYSSGRGDFTIEPYNHAEHDLLDIDFNEEPSDHLYEGVVSQYT